MQIAESSFPGRTDRSYLILVGVVSVIAAGLVAYSQTMAFAYDEGFHLLTAQLIKAGKRPYLDFFFPQTALNAYWNALWMQAFGEGWRAPHAAAALLTSAATMLTVDFVYFRCPAPEWRLTAGLATAFIVGTNAMAVEFGTIGQAYGICTFLSVAAFRCAAASVGSRNLAWPLLVGLLSAAGAGCSLLAAPVAPVLAIWMLIWNRAGSRWVKLVALATGAAAAAGPLVWLYVQAPREVWFNIFEYHLRYREVEWSGALQHNLEVVTAWILSPQSLILGLLAISGLWFVRFQSGWGRSRRAEFYLCLWLIIAFTIHISRASPTFERYYILCVPFLAILAAMGLYSAGSRLSTKRSLAALVILITSLGMARRLYDSRDDTSWKTYEAIAAKVDEVTPRGAPLVADEIVYFLARRVPPTGMEHADAHKLEPPFPAEEVARLHVLPQSALDAMIRQGSFATVETCKDDDKLAALGLAAMYRQKAAFDDCTVYWDLAPQVSK